jgi:MFS family permease
MSSLQSDASAPGAVSTLPSLADARAFPIRGQLLRTSLRYTLLAWIPGAFWQGVTGSTAMTPFGQFLGANDFLFALITAAPNIGAVLMIPGALLVERLGRRKKFFISTVTPHRALYIVIGLLPWILPPAYATAALLAFLIFLSMGLNSFGGQAWVNWMADLVPPRVRGKYFARRSRMGVAVISAATVLTGVILDQADHPAMARWLSSLTAHTVLPRLIIIISAVFMLAGAVGMLDILSFIKVAEPPMRPASRQPWRERLVGPMRDTQFRRYVVYWSFSWGATNWCTWFWMLYLQDFLTRQHRAAAQVGGKPWWGDALFLTSAVILPVSFMIGQFLGYPVWGRAVDRFGRKPVFLVSSTLHTLSWLSWIFLSPAMLPWMLPIQIAGGLAGGGMDIASFNMMLQFNRKGGPNYQAVGSVVFSLVAGLAALAAGALSTALAGWTWTFAPGTAWEHTFNHYVILILIGAAIKYAGDLLVLPRLHDLDSKPAGHALRFVFNNFYDTLNSLIFLPLRTATETTTSGIRKLWR